MVSKFERKNNDPHRVRNVFHVDFGTAKPRPDVQALSERLLARGEDAILAVRKLKGNLPALSLVVNSKLVDPNVQKEAVRLLVQMFKDDSFPKERFDRNSLLTIMVCAEYAEDQNRAVTVLLESDPELNAVTGSARAVCECYELTANPKVKALLFERLEHIINLADEDQLRKLGMQTMVLPHVIARTSDEELAFRLFEYIIIPTQFCVVMDLCADNPERGFKILAKMEKDTGNLAAVAIENKNALLRGKAILMLLGDYESLEAVAEMGMFEDTAQVAISLLPEEKRAEAQRKRNESKAECQSSLELSKEDEANVMEFLDSLSAAFLEIIPQYIKNNAARFDTAETDEAKIRESLKPIWSNEKVLEALCHMSENVLLRQIIVKRLKQLEFGSDLSGS